MIFSKSAIFSSLISLVLLALPSTAAAGDCLDFEWSTYQDKRYVSAETARKIDECLETRALFRSLVDDYEELVRIYEEENDTLRGARRDLLEDLDDFSSWLEDAHEREARRDDLLEDSTRIAEQTLDELEEDRRRREEILRKVKIAGGTVGGLLAAYFLADAIALLLAR
jgi:hypothetical protein